MIRYNWAAIRKYTKLDLKKVIGFIDNVYVDNSKLAEFLMNNEYARKIVKESVHDKCNSFILNYTGFRNNYSNGTDQERLVYLDLLSRRNLFTYLNTKNKVIYIPKWRVLNDYNIEKLKMNRLLFINENYIYFIYEGDY